MFDPGMHMKDDTLLDSSRHHADRFLYSKVNIIAESNACARQGRSCRNRPEFYRASDSSHLFFTSTHEHMQRLLQDTQDALEMAATLCVTHTHTRLSFS